MQNENSRNMMIFVVCAALLLVVYQVFVMGPELKRQRETLAAQERAKAAAQANPASNASSGPADVPVLEAPSRFVSRAEAVARSPRVAIDTPFLSGSISLVGGRLDDLFLKTYRETVDPRSPPVELLRPLGMEHAWYVQQGWTRPGGAQPLSENAVWRVVGGDRLSVGRPVTLQTETADGLVFQRAITVDDRYVFTVVDRVINRSSQPQILAPYAAVRRYGHPADVGHNTIVHEGAIGVFGTELHDAKYKNLQKKPFDRKAVGGWVGLTDKYWLTAVIPDQKKEFHGNFTGRGEKGDIYGAGYLGSARKVAPGEAAIETARVFAGAKRAELLRDYEKSLGVPRLYDAIDWGRFFIFTKPFFTALEFLFHLIGNFGLAILALTVVVKAAFYPLANQAFASMTKMKKIAPKVEELKKKYANDAAKQQQETLALYQREKINPLTGCLPILIQIPVFFALYKTLFVTIEMRHAPFFGWVNDLSARDPTTIWNLFGLIPFDPGALPLVGGVLGGPLHLGVWPLLYGLTMGLQQSMSPPSTDPTQQQIMRFFPLVFTVVLAQSPAGLVIYWCWSNLLTIAQQYLMMRRHGVENPIDDFIGKVSERIRAARADRS